MSQLALELTSTRNDWCSRVAPEVLRLMRGRSEFSTDDLHGVIEEPEHFNWFGILLAKLKNQGSVEAVGWKVSRRPEANGRKVTTWRAVA